MREDPHFIVIHWLLCPGGNWITYVPSWWTVYAPTSSIFTCLFPRLRSNTNIFLEWVHSNSVNYSLVKPLDYRNSRPESMDVFITYIQEQTSENEKHSSHTLTTADVRQLPSYIFTTRVARQGSPTITDISGCLPSFQRLPVSHLRALSINNNPCGQHFS